MAPPRVSIGRKRRFLLLGALNVALTNLLLQLLLWAEYPLVIGPIVAGKADVVFGSRFQCATPHRVAHF